MNLGCDVYLQRRSSFFRRSWTVSLRSRAVPDEIVVCDDGSTDGTRELLERFAAESPVSVSLHFNEKNLGSVKNFERAIRLCNGDIIALSDQDDVWRQDKLKLIEEAFNESNATGLVFSDAEIVDENLKATQPPDVE
jgi:glycosyltransferase involved in cell wall biosynthesis